ncbi:MAG: hypothetical protein GY755_25115, partial [Chloroflexi bacterium]|nr:hypothetical protein [Chloroflexota bacterium]
FRNVFISLLFMKDNNRKWNEVEKVLNIMKECDIQPNVGTYFKLFELCIDDIQRARMYYDQMVNESQVSCNMTSLQLIMNVGENYFQKEENKNKIEEAKEFVEWIIYQYKIYDIIPTRQVKEQWKLPILSQHD